MATRTDVSFQSSGQRCAAWLYLPTEPVETVPCVVMGHGVTGTRDLGLALYAERFAAAGFAVVVFDYRHFGASGGQPRQLVSIDRQLADWRSAIRFARALPQIDPRRVAIWGTSLGAGHVVSVAADDPALAAVVAQLPFMGVDVGRSSPRSAAVTGRLLAAAVVDVIGGFVGRSPMTVRVVGEPGQVAVFTGVEDLRAIRALAAAAPTWRNEMVARSLFSLVRYRPGALASRVRVPLLICVADGDTASSVPLTVRAARQAPHGELRHYPGGHFTAYTGEVFERMVSDQVEFLRRHLVATPMNETRTPSHRRAD